MIQLPRDVMLIPDFRVAFNAEEPAENWKQLEEWLSQVMRSLEEYFSKARQDFEYGHAIHRVYTSTPAVTEVENGEVVFVDDGIADQRGITKLNGALYEWTITAV